MSRSYLAHLLAVVVLALGSASCSRPTVRVCRSLGAEGRCEGASSELRVGSPYVVKVTGFGLPERDAEIRLVLLSGPRAGTLGTRPLVRAAGKSYLENPVLLPEPGRYRIEIRAEGSLYAQTEVSAPRPSFWVVDAGTPLPQIRQAPPPIHGGPILHLPEPRR